MNMIQITNERWEKFYLNASLVETVQPLMGGKSQINLTTGKYIVCIENPEEVNKLLSKVEDVEKK